MPNGPHPSSVGRAVPIFVFGRKIVAACAVFLAVLSASACADLSTGVGSAAPDRPAYAQLQDPCSGCTGIFLTGAAADPMICILAPGADVDHDGVDDQCEYKVAAAFAPQLVFHGSEVRRSRETYWGVHRASPETTNSLRIAYLLGYHDDSQHTGDSEYIELLVFFDTSQTTGGVAGRWVLLAAYYSAHNGYNTYLHPDLTYVDGQMQDRPIVWVANGKHANYNTDSACDAGGTLGYDDCNDGSRESVDVVGNRNIGSYYYPLKNEVYSFDSSLTGREYLWTTAGDFNGWHSQPWKLIPGQHVAPYGERLQGFGWFETPFDPRY